MHERISGYAGDWNSLKDSVVELLGVERDAAHILASVAILIAVATAARKPLWSWWPWVAVLTLEILNEAASAYSDGLVEHW